ncbi:MAG: MMPL family transporter [Acholeplasmatales bacterium]|nr:MMPL family transporter [Acholeplasmatales bacterium]
MKKGLNIMEKEFGDTTSQESDYESFKIMFKDVKTEDKEIIYEVIMSYDKVDSVEHDETEKYNKDGYSLYVVNTKYKSTAKTEKLMNKIENKLDDYKSYTYYSGSQNNIIGKLVPIAFIILIVVLFLACKSFVEPIIIMLNIGVAIIINMGTNFIFPSVSDTTNSIASVLQLILSIDYAIIFINRFRQEKIVYPDDLNRAMKHTVKNGFSSIIASSLTTFLGLLALSFMSFKIGLDMGLVLAKGVICSLICIFTIFPALLVWLNPIIEKTEKKRLIAKLSKKNKKEGEANA